jgi:hypothetical protein
LIRLLICILVLAALVGCGPLPGPAPSASPSILRTPTPLPSATSTQACNGASLVYHPYRLRALGACALYRGTVIANLHETDGDHHLWVAPDPGYDGYLAPANLYHGVPALVAEIVPACTTEPADSAAAARCPASTLHEPAVREHVEIVGPWVADTLHGDWHELHPVVSIRVLGGEPPAGLRFPTPGPGDTDSDG